MEVAPVGAKTTRRTFLRRVLRGGAALTGVAGLGVGYGFWEASQIRTRLARSGQVGKAFGEGGLLWWES